ncbi:hypothetical protein PInf_013110 [Phytophthora infestans]|nr:hypothetical protein PInf_013110 [Phytophthora infestans]
MSSIDAVQAVLKNKCLFDSKLNAAGNEAYVDEVRVVMKECQSIVLRVFRGRFDKLETTNLDWIGYLDPRVAKTMSHVKPEKLAETRQKFLEAGVNMADNVVLPASNTESSSREPLASPELVLNRMFGYSESEDNSPVEKKCADEIVKYLDIAKALIVPKRPQDFDTSKPGITEEVTFTLTADDWSVYDPQIGSGFNQVAEDGTFVVAIKPETDCDVYNTITNELCAQFTLDTGSLNFGINGTTSRRR